MTYTIEERLARTELQLERILDHLTANRAVLGDMQRIPETVDISSTGGFRDPENGESEKAATELAQQAQDDVDYETFDIFIDASDEEIKGPETVAPWDLSDAELESEVHGRQAYPDRGYLPEA